MCSCFFCTLRTGSTQRVCIYRIGKSQTDELECRLEEVGEFAGGRKRRRRRRWWRCREKIGYVSWVKRQAGAKRKENDLWEEEWYNTQQQQQQNEWMTFSPVQPETVSEFRSLSFLFSSTVPALRKPSFHAPCPPNTIWIEQRQVKVTFSPP